MIAATPTPRAVKRLLAVDPGLPDCGAAVFEDGRLVKAAWCRVAAPGPGLDAPACERGADRWMESGVAAGDAMTRGAEEAGEGPHAGAAHPDDVDVHQPMIFSMVSFARRSTSERSSSFTFG